jgi:hypothetical protein
MSNVTTRPFHSGLQNRFGFSRARAAPIVNGTCRPIGREELQSLVLDSVRESFQGNHRHPLMNQRAVSLSGSQPNPEGSYTMKA